MFILGYFLNAAAMVLSSVLYFYLWIVIIRAVLSWVNPDPYNPIVSFINNITDPPLYWIRSRLPINFGGIDFSPFIIILAIMFLQEFLVNSLKRTALYFI